MEKEIKYPDQICKVAHKQNTLSVEQHLCRPEESQPPLEMHAGYSRFTMFVLDVSGKEKQYPMANIPVNDFAAIKKKTDFISKLAFRKQMEPEEEKDICYTQVIMTGCFKGKTPAEILKNPDNADELLKTKEFLKKNEERYEANKRQIAAIDQAVEKYTNGTLDSGIQLQTFPVYSLDHPKTLRSRVRDDGKCLVYDISIAYNPSFSNPVSIFISNHYGTVTQREDGKLSFCNDACDFMKAEIRLSLNEWLRVVDRMDRTISNFELISQIKNLIK